VSIAPADLIRMATERWHSLPRRYVPRLVRVDFLDTGDKQYIRMFAPENELIGLYEVRVNGGLIPLSKPWPVLVPASATGSSGLTSD
jgi:hypothetical protein